MLRRTKIVATLGPASNDQKVLEQMIRAGVDLVRMNFSHGTAHDHMQRAETVREVARACGRTVGILADLQGPKIRIRKFENDKIELNNGDTFILDASFDGLGNQERVGLDYKELPNDVDAGTILLLNDGMLEFHVSQVKGSQVICKVVRGGVLSNNKGINRKGGGLTAPALTDKDKEDIKTAALIKADYLAVSFPRTGEDMRLARDLMHAAGGKSLLMAKIERAEAIPALADIIEASDAIMVARGDLSVEVGDAAVPGLQKRMIKMAREKNRLVITATQMMESMIKQSDPDTRRSIGRGQCGAGWHRCGDALGGNRGRRLPGGNHRGDGAHLSQGRSRRGRSYDRPPQHCAKIFPHRPIDRDVGAVCRFAPQGEGDRRADTIRFHPAVDVADECRRADLCDDAAARDAEQGDAVQRCASDRVRKQVDRLFTDAARRRGRAGKVETGHRREI